MPKTPRVAAGSCAVLLVCALAGCSGGDGSHDGSGSGGDASPFAPAVAAQGGALPGGGRLVITTEGGVRLVGGGGDRVRVEDGTKAHWDGEGPTRTLDLPCDENDRRAEKNCGGMPVVHVPSGADVTVSARNAGVDVTGVRGALTLTTVNGDVTVQDAGDRHERSRLVTRNGSVRATGLRAAHLGAETVNGDVDLACDNAPGDVSGVSRNGSVRVTLPSDAPSYAADATTVNGRTDVDVPSSSPKEHELSLRTVNGDVEAHRG
ncbi:DUF4097 family beta strand repeat-containing protein [Streptomyces tsukubensis]|uniref:DUF4097 domain-containing protein n=1 Tax=Streptomyces tsukubensis TaxID=83656 RepID=A0A1V4ADC8_9ACTN|nr:DUF4097 family beta strand repeat-containing protein [Streptomyces tsukubensis]OON81499.1 hypothetical protein B1H18_08660 [Streptomyces tsukubensis]QFR95488.1 DUF4097 family beta strand repeat protein [Streptomyces tsukubensis]